MRLVILDAEVILCKAESGKPGPGAPEELSGCSFTQTHNCTHSEQFLGFLCADDHVLGGNQPFITNR